MIFTGNYSGSLDSRQQILDMINIATFLYYILPASLPNDKTVRFCEDQNRYSLEAEVGSWETDLRASWFVFLMLCGFRISSGEWRVESGEWRQSQDSHATYRYPLPCTAHRINLPPVLFKVEKETSLFLPLIRTSQDSWKGYNHVNQPACASTIFCNINGKCDCSPTYLMIL